MAGFLVQSSVPTTNSKAAPSNTTTHWQMGLPSQAPLPLTALPLSNSPHQEHPPAPAWGCSGHLLPYRAPPTLTLEFYPVFFFFFLILLLFLKPLLPTFSALSQTDSSEALQLCWLAQLCPVPGAAELSGTCQNLSQLAGASLNLSSQHVPAAQWGMAPLSGRQCSLGHSYHSPGFPKQATESLLLFKT